MRWYFGILIGLLLAGTVTGDELIDRIIVGPRIGMYDAAEASEWNDAVGAMARYRHGNWGLEASVYYREEWVENETIWIKGWPAEFSGMFYPLKPVYVLSGLAIYNVFAQYDRSVEKLAALESGNRFSWGYHVGAGLQVQLGERSHLALDGRYVWFDYKLQDFPGSSDIASDAWMVTTALMFNFR